jgi:hypothetical protein
MSLFVVLVPLGVMGTAFSERVAIPAALASTEAVSSDVPGTPASVTVSLRIGTDALELTAWSTSLGDDALAALARRWPVGEGGEYDVPALQAHLRAIKARHPESNTMVVLGHGELDYRTLVGILDQTREYPVVEGDGGEPRFAELFPSVVFADWRLARPPIAADVADEEDAP